MKRIEVTGKKLKELFYFTMFIPTLNVTKINDINVYNIYDDNTLKNSMEQIVGSWKGMSFQELISVVAKEKIYEIEPSFYINTSGKRINPNKKHEIIDLVFSSTGDFENKEITRFFFSDGSVFLKEGNEFNYIAKRYIP